MQVNSGLDVAHPWSSLVFGDMVHDPSLDMSQLWSGIYIVFGEVRCLWSGLDMSHMWSALEFGDVVESGLDMNHLWSGLVLNDVEVLVASYQLYNGFKPKSLLDNHGG